MRTWMTKTRMVLTRRRRVWLLRCSPQGLGAAGLVAIFLAACSTSLPLPSGTVEATIHWTDPTAAASGGQRAFSGTIADAALSGTATVSFSQGAAVHTLVGKLGSDSFHIVAKSVNPAAGLCRDTSPFKCQPGTGPYHIAVSGTFAGHAIHGTATPDNGSEVMSVHGTVGGQSIITTWTIPADTCCDQQTTSLSAQVN
jgi:hypothetical protein